MVLLTKRPETTKNINRSGPVGAPKASHVKEVLLTLKTRLEAQLETNDDHDLAMFRALQANVQSQLAQINEAIDQIEEGKYGVCTECLRPIESDRLVVRPYSTLCMACQNRRDRSRSARS